MASVEEALSFNEFAQSIVPQNVFSQFGEDGALKAIFDKIGATNKFCVEFGINNGIFFSNTRRLIAQEGWSGLWIEGDGSLAEMARANAATSGLNVTILTRMVEVEGPNSLDALLAEVSAPEEFDLLSIDVDGQDFYLWNSLMRYRPRVVVCEFDPFAEPHFIPDIGGPGQASQLMIHNVAVSRGYQPVCKTQVNLICVRNDLCALLADASGHDAQSRLEPEMIKQCQHGRAIGQVTVFSNGLALRVGDCRCCRNLFGIYDADANPHYCPSCTKPAQPSEPANRLESLGGMAPAKEPMPRAAPTIAGYTERELIEAKEKRAREGNFLFAGCMSAPRWGPLSTMSVIQMALSPWNVPFFLHEGAYWHHQLSEAIEEALKLHPDGIMAFDYDSLFCPAPQQSDVAKLVTLLLENPDVDVIAPLQLQREGGSLIAIADGEMEIGKPLMPVWFAHFGMTIFRASVFERLAKPWFWEKPDPNGGWKEGRTDADTGFWLNCKENGIKVCMATDVVLGHGEYGPTFPDDEFKPIRMSVNAWRRNGMRPPSNAFNRQRFIAAALNGTNPIAKVETHEPVGS